MSAQVSERAVGEPACRPGSVTPGSGACGGSKLVLETGTLTCINLCLSVPGWRHPVVHAMCTGLDPVPWGPGFRRSPRIKEINPVGPPKVPLTCGDAAPSGCPGVRINSEFIPN